MQLPNWLQEEHEYNNGSLYSTGGNQVYSVLELDGKTVRYTLNADGRYEYSREFKTESSATRFYVRSARRMREAAKRNTVPLWDHLQ